MRSSKFPDRPSQSGTASPAPKRRRMATLSEQASPQLPAFLGAVRPSFGTVPTTPRVPAHHQGLMEVAGRRARVMNTSMSPLRHGLLGIDEEIGDLVLPSPVFRLQPTSAPRPMLSRASSEGSQTGFQQFKDWQQASATQARSVARSRRMSEAPSRAEAQALLNPYAGGFNLRLDQVNASLLARPEEEDLRQPFTLSSSPALSVRSMGDAQTRMERLNERLELGEEAGGIGELEHESESNKLLDAVKRFWGRSLRGLDEPGSA